MGRFNLRYNMKAENITGKQFGRLTVLERTGTTRQGNALWLCQCTCSGTTIVRGADLRNGHTISCGCFCVEQTSQANTKHGHSGKAGERSSEYTSWLSMRRRCEEVTHEHYKYYGGRGIIVCDRWKDFALFLTDMGNKPTEAHTIERKNTDGNYEPTNCIWATQQEQLDNRRPNGYYATLALAQED